MNDLFTLPDIERKKITRGLHKHIAAKTRNIECEIGLN